MKSFETIEEGRLKKSEMSTLVGGAMSCSTNYSREDEMCTYATGLASCPGTYTSCNSTSNFSCTVTGGYSGPAGPGGYEQPYTPPGGGSGFSETCDPCEAETLHP